MAQMQIAADLTLLRAGTGTVVITTFVNDVKHIRRIPGVWYVPGLTVNMLSTQLLVKNGCWHVHGMNGDPNDYWVDERNVPFLTCCPSDGLLLPEARFAENIDVLNQPENLPDWITAARTQPVLIQPVAHVAGCRALCL